MPPPPTLIAPLVSRLSAVPTGGAQAVVADLARGLGAAGCAAELVAAPGSRLHGFTIRPAPGGPFPDELLRLGGDGAGPVPPGRQLPVWEALAAQLDGDREGAVVHAHAMDWAAFAALTGRRRPVVHTLHLGPVADRAVAALRSAAAAPRPPVLVAPSGVVAALWAPHVGVDLVIGNGVDPDVARPAARTVAGLAVVAGRISPEKGTDTSVAAALAAGFRVVVAGRVDDAAFHRERVLPLLGGGAGEHVGALPRARLLRLLARAAVVVQASRWAEPFGMTVIEAAMCGTPVAVTPRGALPDVVGNDLGVVADRTDVEAVRRAVTAAAGMDRAAVRAAAISRHSLARAVDRHLQLYTALTGGRPASGSGMLAG